MTIGEKIKKIKKETWMLGRSRPVQDGSDFSRSTLLSCVRTQHLTVSSAVFASPAYQLVDPEERERHAFNCSLISLQKKKDRSDLETAKRSLQS